MFPSPTRCSVVNEHRQGQYGKRKGKGGATFPSLHPNVHVLSESAPESVKRVASTLSGTAPRTIAYVSVCIHLHTGHPRPAVSVSFFCFRFFFLGQFGVLQLQLLRLCFRLHGRNASDMVEPVKRPSRRRS